MDGCDMIANLGRLPEIQLNSGIQIKRAFPGDKQQILRFIGEHFSQNWINETEYAMMQSPGKCFIAVDKGEVVGFACYDASALGFFGPIGVRDDRRGENIGAALLVRTLTAMHEQGYQYAIIGWVNEAEHFYRKIVGAEWIKGGEPQNSVYANLIRME